MDKHLFLKKKKSFDIKMAGGKFKYQGSHFLLTNDDLI